jgi:ABC-type uncharacterized transport system involved in gliding motility auxiliary subunit
MKKILETTNLGVAIVAALAIAAAANWLAFRHYGRWDVTKAKVYSLSDKSAGVLKGLTKDVTVYVLFDNREPLFDNVNELLKRYEAASPRIRVTMIDPEKNLLQAKQLVEELGITQNNSVVIACGEKKKFIYASDMAEYDYQAMQYGQPPSVKAFKGEEAITSAILNVSEDRQAKVGFLTGHGERSSTDPGPDGLTAMAEQLKKDNYAVEEVSLLGKSEVPADLSVLVCMGPRAAFLPQEAEALTKYAAAGGSVLLGLDPQFDTARFTVSPTGLAGFLGANGLAVGDDLVIDEGKTMPFMGPEVVYVDAFRSHPVTDKLQRVPVLLPIARSVTTVPTPEGVKVQVLMETTADGWGETDLKGLFQKKQVAKDPADKKGPVALAAIAESKGRVLLVGNSAYAANAYVPNLGNEQFFTQAVHFLAQRTALIEVPPKPVERVALTLNAGQMRTAFVVVLLLMPGLAVAAGIFVWRMRRK